MKIGIGNDHSAVELKNEILKHLISRGYEVVNYGTDSMDSYNYVDAAKSVTSAVVQGEIDCGICICGTGIGISIACNKVDGIRACVCSEPFSAKLAKQHNDANVLCFGARVVGVELAKMIVDEWLNAQFEGGRHAERVATIMALENNED